MKITRANVTGRCRARRVRRTALIGKGKTMIVIHC